MAGLNEEQWGVVQKGLSDVEALKGDIMEIKVSIKDLTKAFTEFQVDYTAACTEIFGRKGDNGLKKKINDNSLAIKKIKEKPAKQRKTWIPVIVAIVAVLTGPLWGWIWMKILPNIP